MLAYTPNSSHLFRQVCLYGEGTVYFGTFRDDTVIRKNGIAWQTAATKGGMGSFSVSQGDVFTSTKPFIGVANSGGVCLANGAHIGRLFGIVCTRYSPNDFYFYSWDGPAVVHYYDMGGNGNLLDLSATAPTASIAVPQGVVTTTQQAFVGSNNNFFFFASRPVCILKRGSAGDYTMLTPFTQELWSGHSTASVILRLAGTNELLRSNHFGRVGGKGGAMTTIGDGAGGDAVNGKARKWSGFEYILPHDVRDYTLHAIETGYVWALTSSGTLYNVYTLNGTPSSPVFQQVGSASGAVAEAVLISGWARLVGNICFDVRSNTPAEDEYHAHGPAYDNDQPFVQGRTYLGSDEILDSAVTNKTSITYTLSGLGPNRPDRRLVLAYGWRVDGGSGTLAIAGVSVNGISAWKLAEGNATDPTILFGAELWEAPCPVDQEVEVTITLTSITASSVWLRRGAWVTTGMAFNGSADSFDDNASNVVSGDLDVEVDDQVFMVLVSNIGTTNSQVSYGGLIGTQTIAEFAEDEEAIADPGDRSDTFAVASGKVTAGQAAASLSAIVASGGSQYTCGCAFTQRKRTNVQDL